ncbi:hypothetical protein SDC9_113583 [bioreactor metagenome]|uniref:Uncharacterized protein n=1 Tax=bioreactor metagenome TaxID=1076179 RepID=A0A645BTV6_9ZZZZ
MRQQGVYAELCVDQHRAHAQALSFLDALYFVGEKQTAAHRTIQTLQGKCIQPIGELLQHFLGGMT